MLKFEAAWFVPKKRQDEEQNKARVESRCELYRDWLPTVRTPWQSPVKSAPNGPGLTRAGRSAAAVSATATAARRRHSQQPDITADPAGTASLRARPLAPVWTRSLLTSLGVEPPTERDSLPSVGKAEQKEGSPGRLGASATLLPWATQGPRPSGPARRDPGQPRRSDVGGGPRRPTWHHRLPPPLWESTRGHPGPTLAPQSESELTETGARAQGPPPFSPPRPAPLRTGTNRRGSPLEGPKTPKSPWIQSPGWSRTTSALKEGMHGHRRAEEVGRRSDVSILWRSETTGLFTGKK